MGGARHVRRIDIIGAPIHEITDRRAIKSLYKSVRNACSSLSRMGVPIGVLALCLWMLWPHLSAHTLAQLAADLGQISWQAWLAALSLTVISLWAVGRYDGVAHRHFGTRIPDHYARWSGTIAIGLSQSLGFGILTGSCVRWRMLCSLTFPQSLKLSTFVAMTFVVGWGFVTALACLLLPAPAWAILPAALAVGLSPFVIFALLRWPNLRWRGHIVRLPSLRSWMAIIGWSALDTIAAAAVLFILLPHGTTLPFSAFVPVFLLALGAGLFSNTPGGLGPFEVLLIALLPDIGAAQILSSIVAYRTVYYALPLGFSVLALFFPLRAIGKTHREATFDLACAPNAEVAVIAQNGGAILATDDGACAIWPTAQTVTALCDPLRGSAGALLSGLKFEAHAQGRFAMIYKCGARSAQIARRAGWAVMHISDDAIVAPQRFDLNQPALRNLRRKLRACHKAHVRIEWEGLPPWSEMARIDKAWQVAHGTARGGTMGRFEPQYLSTHFIARATVAGKLVAFASFQRCTSEWCLDVMRHGDALPDGTMHALVHCAIEQASLHGITRLSLAATPACPDPHSRFYRWLARIAVTKAGGTGLRQFKSSFAPLWQPRYAAAPNAATLTLGLLDITREVHHPSDLPPLNGQTHNDNIAALHPNEIHNSDENNEVVTRRAS